MVILDEEAATERSPLKGQNPPLPPQTQSAQSQQGAPPPPYAPSAPSSPVHPHGYQSIPPHHQHFPHPHAHHPHAHPHFQNQHPHFNQQHPQHPHQHYVTGADESPALLIRRDTPGQRFLKAFLCAVFVLFLWSLFIDTVSMVAGHRHRYGGYIRRGPWNDRLREDLNSNNNHTQATSSAPCPCATSTSTSTPTPRVDPIRVIPIQYPPARNWPSVLPVASGSGGGRTVPCAAATPTTLD